MKFLTAIIQLLARHKDSLVTVGMNEANGNLLKVSLQLNRLRTAAEQRDLLFSYYTATLTKLKELDDSGDTQLPMLGEFIAQGEVNVEQVTSYTNEFAGFIGLTGQLETIDFTSIENAALDAIPKDHDAYPILTAYKDYIAQEHFLTRIKELMDLLDEDAHRSDKLTDSEVQDVKAEKNIPLTAAQRVLAMYYLMRWAGVELGERQGARHQRFIAALTGIAIGTVKERFPNASVARKPYHIENLRALVPLFESVNASTLVQKIQSAIQFEQEEQQD